ncbi:MAG: restriction endonuclease subunit S, partial [Nitrososphaera sp.]|nr:restriction endonuclease subunit S [Nitrososphaera sp.]
MKLTYLRPYPEYKDSGLPWLGKIPAHWSVRRNKLFLREVNERSIDGSEDLLTVSQYTGVTRRRDRLTDDNELLTNAASLVGYKSVRRGDIAVNIMLAWNGSLGTSPIDGIVSPAYCVYRASSAANPWFLHYLFRTSLFTGVFKTGSTGVVDSRLRLYPDVFFRLPSLLPPPEEQDAIARFLNYQDRLIRRFISAKRRMIELLNEQKQAIINQAVTRGLDPSVRLKHSGVDWLGDVPDHWEIMRCKYIFREVDERSRTGSETHLAMSQKLGLVPSSQLDERRLHSESYEGAKLCRTNDLVLNRLKAHLGVFALAHQDGLVSPDYTVFRPIQQLDIQYYEYLLKTPVSRTELRRRAKGIVQGFWRLYTDDFNDIRLPVPLLSEQHEIVSNLNKKFEHTNQSIERTQREIDLIREYRERLITDVVTGKVDVRHLAASLPAAPEVREEFPEADTEEPLIENEE